MSLLLVTSVNVGITLLRETRAVAHVHKQHVRLAVFAKIPIFKKVMVAVSAHAKYQEVEHKVATLASVAMNFMEN